MAVVYRAALHVFLLPLTFLLPLLVARLVHCGVRRRPQGLGGQAAV